MNEILTFVESLIPLIKELRHTTENDRRIAAPIVEAIRNSDLCRMLLDTGTPPQYTPEEWLSVLETLSGAEASVSWFIWNNTLPCFWARFLDDAGRARIFGDSKILFAGSTRPTGQAMTTQGGFRLSGRWSLVSGCELADYICVAVMWDKVKNQLPTAEDRAALYSASLYGIAAGRAAVVAMHMAAGTTALYVGCPLERSIRDLQTMDRHVGAQPLWLEDSGRVLLGHKPKNPLFMI